LSTHNIASLNLPAPFLLLLAGKTEDEREKGGRAEEIGKDKDNITQIALFCKPCLIFSRQVKKEQ